MTRANVRGLRGRSETRPPVSQGKRPRSPLCLGCRKRVAVRVCDRPGCRTGLCERCGTHDAFGNDRCGGHRRAA